MADNSKTFPGLSNIEASLRLIAGNIANVNTAVDDLTTEMATINTSILSVFPPPLTSSATWNPANLLTLTQDTMTIAVSGAALGNSVQTSFSLDLQGMTLTGYVSSANTVTVVLFNGTAGTINLASGTLKVRVYA